MKTEDALAQALETAIPFFKANREDLAKMLGMRSQNLDEVLGDEFCTYVEWKEFASWGIESLNETVPLAKNGLILSVDELYDDAMPEDDDDDPYEFLCLRSKPSLLLISFNWLKYAAWRGISLSRQKILVWFVSAQRMAAWKSLTLYFSMWA